jgi:hypothetical protein
MGGSGDRLWILAVAYAAAALLALAASLVSRQRRDRAFWAVMSVTLLVLALAKAFQLQGLLTNWLRATARQHHLYESRALIQYSLLLILVVAAIILAKRLKLWVGTATRSVATAALAMTVLVAFILIRAASIHALDSEMTMKIAGLRSGWWVELTGIFAIAVAAGVFVRDRGRRR